MAKKTRVPEKYRVDFSKEEGGGGGGVKVKPGDYRAKIVNIEAKQTKEEEKPMLVFYYQLLSNAATGKKVTASGTIRDHIVIQPNTLWRLRKLLEAIGKTVPKKTVNLKLKSYIDETFILTVDDGEEYKGKVKSEAQDYLNEEEYDEEPDDDDEDEDEEDEDEEDLEDLDRDELKALIKKEKLDIKVKKSMDEEDIVAAIEEARESDDDDEDEDEDEDLEEMDVDDDL